MASNRSFTIQRFPCPKPLSERDSGLPKPALPQAATPAQARKRIHGNQPNRQVVDGLRGDDPVEYAEGVARSLRIRRHLKSAATRILFIRPGNCTLKSV